MRKKFKFNIWNYLDINIVNDILDEAVKNNCYPTGIGYKCLQIAENGDLTIQADFVKA